MSNYLNTINFIVMAIIQLAFCALIGYAIGRTYGLWGLPLAAGMGWFINMPNPYKALKK